MNPKAVLRTTVKILSDKKLTIPTAATVGVISAYNIATDGVQKGMRNARVEMSKGYTDLYVKSQPQNHYSNLLVKMQKFIRQINFDNPLYPAIAYSKNVLGSVIMETGRHAVPVALGAGAVGAPFLANKIALLGAHAGTVGSAVSAVCTSLLLIGAGKILLNDVLGIGKKGL